MLRILTAIAIVGVFVVGFLFAFYNAGDVRLDYVAGVVETRFAFVIYGAFAAGSVLGLIAGFFAFLRQRREAAALRAHIQQLESELASLRASLTKGPD